MFKNSLSGERVRMAQRQNDSVSLWHWGKKTWCVTLARCVTLAWRVTLAQRQNI